MQRGAKVVGGRVGACENLDQAFGRRNRDATFFLGQTQLKNGGKDVTRTPERDMSSWQWCKENSIAVVPRRRCCSATPPMCHRNRSRPVLLLGPKCPVCSRQKPVEGTLTPRQRPLTTKRERRPSWLNKKTRGGRLERRTQNF